MVFFVQFFKKICYTLLDIMVSICGLYANTEVNHDDNGMPIFEPGYSIRLTGKAYEIPMEDIKAKNNPIFDVCIKDQEKYQAMVIFCIKSARGDVFDYDFELSSRENKLNRIYFSYNGEKTKPRGLILDEDTCVACGMCKRKCSFTAIKQDGKIYSIDSNRCDECGDCLIVCPVKAISIR